MENGTAVKGLNARKSTYRTFIATDGGKRWCIGVSSSVTLRELAEWLATPGALGNFRVKTALNLDGGSSSAFWCHESGISYPAFKPLQVRHRVFPRLPCAAAKPQTAGSRPERPSHPAGRTGSFPYSPRAASTEAPEDTSAPGWMRGAGEGKSRWAWI